MSVKKYPEYKELVEKTKDLAVPDRVFTNQELSDLLGLDISSGKGRSQFYMFRRTMLKQHATAFESVHGVGYRVVAAFEHSRLAVRQMRLSQNRLRAGQKIQRHVDMSQLTPDEAKTATDVLVRIGRQLKSGKQEIKGARQLLEPTTYSRLPKPALSIAAPTVVT